MRRTSGFLPLPPEENGVVNERAVRLRRSSRRLPEAVFALLADPHRHHELDGSGTVRRAVSGPRRLQLGDRFGMRMRIGLPYRITNRVVELEPDRRIAWCHFARASWRYSRYGGTRVTETFDGRVAVRPRDRAAGLARAQRPLDRRHAAPPAGPLR